MSTMGSTYSGGIACPDCGRWIIAGSSHQCPAADPRLNPARAATPPMTPTGPTVEERTALALERIAAVLEAIVIVPAPVAVPHPTQPYPFGPPNS